MQFEERQYDAARKNKGTQWISRRWTLKRSDVSDVMYEHILTSEFGEIKPSIGNVHSTVSRCSDVCFIFETCF
jgi:hypothetical protein